MLIIRRNNCPSANRIRVHEKMMVARILCEFTRLFNDKIVDNWFEGNCLVSRNHITVLGGIQTHSSTLLDRNSLSINQG
ncbi:hypothetical protein C497_16802 [Halalkalicoccus jeotgali B3]|uniref:Uncharacterized protein n=1 Tax=Halalkalicoccus jeotgali (strain DSM 18796 / CECT 7217 / JCM 14584 / KCTC 4019 / B3) TaxID=795797 RepID=L9VCI1_HALJB|nr:hypothetical protein C497_16802 [Halalkalicoccus jeotgali B3]